MQKDKIELKNQINRIELKAELCDLTSEEWEFRCKLEDELEQSITMGILFGKRDVVRLG
jgi:hypothetical protein